jgi:hypothetical protein
VDRDWDRDGRRRGWCAKQREGEEATNAHEEGGWRAKWRGGQRRGGDDARHYLKTERERRRENYVGKRMGVTKRCADLDIVYVQENSFANVELPEAREMT